MDADRYDVLNERLWAKPSVCDTPSNIWCRVHEEELFHKADDIESHQILGYGICAACDSIVMIDMQGAIEGHRNKLDYAYGYSSIPCQMQNSIYSGTLYLTRGAAHGAVSKRMRRER